MTIARPNNSVSLRIRSHNRPDGMDAGAAFDLSSVVVAPQRTRRIGGGGGWSFDLMVRPGSEQEEWLQRWIRDDDWADIVIADGPKRSVMLGLVNEVRPHVQVDPESRAVVANYTIAGQDWSKAMTLGQIRIGAILATAKFQTEIPDSSESPLTPWLGTSPAPPAVTFRASSGRALTWTLFRHTGSVDQPDFRDTITDAVTAMGADPAPAHFIIAESGAIHALCDVANLRTAIAEATGQAIDNEAVVVAMVGHAGDSPTASQVSAVADLLRWLQTQAGPGDLARYPLDTNGFRWSTTGPVSPVGGLVGRDEVWRGPSPMLPDPGWSAAIWTGLADAIGSGVSTTEDPGPTNVPGVIDASRWAELLKKMLPGAYDPKGGLEKGLKPFLVEAMRGLWVDPTGKSLLSRLSWSRFGRPSCPGIPWRMLHGFASQGVVTLDGVLREFGCEAYNEIFYDYDSKGNPAVVFRPRPYNREDWRSLPWVKIPASRIAGYDLSRSGDERCNYWRSSASVAIFRGADVTIDTKQGRSPIIDAASIARHGLRVSDPRDDVFPPLAEADDLLSYYRKRIGDFHRWYQQSPEMLTGYITLYGAFPEVVLGSMIELPIPYWFAGRKAKSPAIVGYVVEIDERFRVDSETRNLSGTTGIAFIRGMPPDGLPADPIRPWKEA